MIQPHEKLKMKRLVYAKNLIKSNHYHLNVVIQDQDTLLLNNMFIFNCTGQFSKSKSNVNLVCKILV